MSDSQTWWEAKFEVAEHFSEEMGVLLIEAGALGVQTISEEIPLPALPDIHGNPPEVLELDIQEGNNFLIACFAAEQSEQNILKIVTACQQELGTAESRAPEIVHCDDNSWQTMWKAFFTPRQLGKHFWVIPSWEKDFRAPPASHSIIIDPGMAFGTGHHATTALCLEALEGSIPNEPDFSVLDVGCGSGILSIAACLLGATQVDAIDIDAKAVEVTLENAAINNASQIHAATTPVHEITKPYGLVVANILANILIGLAPGIVQALGPGSILLLSGIPGHQIDAVHTTFNDAYFAARDKNLPKPDLTQAGEWACLRYKTN